MASIVFPKPLPELDKENLPNEVGFTPLEIIALQNIWSLVKQRFKYHASQIFLDFFTENDVLLERFRESPGGKFKLSSLHQHPEKMLTNFGNIIENCLHNVGYFNTVMEEVRHTHRQREIAYNDVKLQMDHIINYIISFFINKKSPTLVTALNKLGDIINNQHLEIEQNYLDNDTMSEGQ